MRPIHFITIMRFARDNDMANKSFDSVVSTIRDSARTKGMELEEYLEQYQ